MFCVISQKSRRIPALLLTCAFAALLTGCGKSDQNNASDAASDTAPPPQAALPLAAGAAPAAAPAPAATELPPPPAPVSYVEAASDDYEYLDRAYAQRQAIADAPPDFTYDYDGQRPMTWRADDGSECVAEQLPDGRLRYYFYQPGADQPYLVQDPDYSYGYSNGTLVVVYDSDGHVVSRDVAQRQEGIAGRYLARARALYQASVRDRHEAVAQANWERQRELVYQDRQRWVQAQERDAAWRAYHQQQQDQEQARWAQERYRREAEASRFAHAINDTAAIARAAQGLAAAADEAKRHNQSIPAGAPPPNAASPAPQPPDRGGRDHQREQRPPQPAQAAPPAPVAAPLARDQHEQRPPQPTQAAPPAPATALPARDQYGQRPLQPAQAAPPTTMPARDHQREQRPPQPVQAAPPAPAAAPAAPPASSPAHERRAERPQRPPQPVHAAPPAPATPPSKALPPKPSAAATTPPAKPANTDHGKKPRDDRKDERPVTP